MSRVELDAENSRLRQELLRAEERLRAAEREVEAAATARAELVTLEAEQRALIEAMRDVILVLDGEGRYVKIPPTAPGLLFRPAQDIIGKRMHDLMPAQDADRFLSVIRQALATQDAVPMEYSLPVGDRVVFFSSVVSPMDEDHVVWVARDVTVQRETEAALRSAAERYRLLFDANPSPMWVYDRASLRFLAVNAAALEQYGYERDEFLSMTVADIRPPEDVAALLQAVADAPNAFHRSRQWRHQRKDGSRIDVEIAAHPIEFDGHDAELVLAHDVTLRNRTEAELRETADVLRAVVDDSPLAIVSVDLELRVTRWNPAAERLLGWTSAEMAGRSLAVIIPEDRAEEARAIRESALRGRAVAYAESQRRRKDGTLVDVSISLAALHDSRGEVSGLMIIIADITERKRLEQRLQQSQKMEAVGQLAGGIAHDFNNLLTAITSYSQMLIDDTPEQDPRRADMDEIRRAADRAAGLTRQLLAFSRQQIVQPQPISLNAVVSELDRMIRRLVREDIEIRLSLQRDLDIVEADPGQIEQALINLVVNARDAMPEGGTIIIETENFEVQTGFVEQGEARAVPSGHYVMLAVTDTGTGMTAELQSRIFEPFFTTKEQGHGTGLGLATVYGIVEQARGHIAVYSEIGRGTTFKVFLPRTEAKVRPASPKDIKEPGQSGSSRTILLVEDNDAVRRVAERVLSLQGYTILAARGGAEALAIVERESDGIDLVLTDMVMPGMSGAQVAAAVRKHLPMTPVLFMSGYTKNAADQLADLPAGSGYLEKPFTPARLTLKVRELLDSVVRPDA